ncbi:MAG TPA: DoxX family protein [Bryobacteraceae bacterium]|nr:DoxX family protein [Bryobacteraceae bacterium]
MAGTKQKDLGIALLRIMVGVVFLAHGSQKLFVMGVGNVGGFLAQIGVPAAPVMGVVLTLTEFLGGLALVLGLFTRWAALLLAFAMLVAVSAVHLQNGFFLPRGFEYALTLLVANVGLALTGAGAYALDNVLFKGRASAPELRRNAA